MAWWFLGKQVAKKGLKNIAKQGAKQTAKTGFLNKTIKVLDYIDPFYWIGRGWRAIKGTVGRNATKKAAEKVAGKAIAGQAIKKASKKTIFNKAATRLSILGGTGLAFGEVLSSVGATLTSPGFIVPSLLGAAAGTYGFYKVNKIINNRKAKKTSQHPDITVEYGDPIPLEKMSPKHIKQIKKLSPEQIKALRAKKTLNNNTKNSLTPAQIHALQQAKHARAA